MKKKQLKLAEKKYQLNAMKRSGKKNPKWSLTKEEREYIQNVLGMRCTECIYEINTRTFYNVKSLPSILKALHYARKDGKRTITKPLKRTEKELLDEYGVKYRPLKYEIHLHTK